MGLCMILCSGFRSGRLPKSEPTEEQEPEEMITVDLYQNPERKNVIVEVTSLSVFVKVIRVAVVLNCGAVDGTTKKSRKKKPERK